MSTKTNLLDLVDFKKVDTLLEGFNKSTGFVTAILDLKGNVLSKSGWRQICTEFHRINPETSKKCTISDTVLAGKMEEGEKYHFYQCLNGLVDVAVPIVIKGEHIVNLFFGQFFFEEPDLSFFKKQAEKYGFNENIYLKLLEEVPVVSKEKVLVAIDFLLNMTQLISEMTFQKLEQMELNETIRKSEERFRNIFENNLATMLLIEPSTHRIVDANYAAERFYGWSRSQLSQMTIDQINTLPSDKLQKEMEIAWSQKRIYFKFKHRIADGSVRDVEIYSSKVEIDGKDYLHSIVHDVTEQVKAEEALKNNEKVLRLFVEYSPASIAMFDTQMRYMVYSKQFLADYDLGQRNIIGLTHYEVFPEIPQRWKDIHQRGLKGEILSDDNDLFPRANGKTDWVRWEIHPWYKNENEIGGIILFSEVITERKNAQNKLKESHQKLVDTLESMTDGFVSLDKEWNYTYMNKRAGEIFGRNPQEMVGKHIWTEFPEGVGQPFHLAYEKAEKDQVAIQFVEFYPPYQKWFENRIYPSEDGISIFFQDITESKLAADALKESEAYNRMLFEQSQMGLALASMEGKLVDINPAYAAIIGRTIEETKQLTYWDITPERYATQEHEQLESLEKTGRYGPYEKEYIHKNGHLVPVRLQGLIIEKDGEKYIWSSVEDISEQKKAELDLIAAKEEIEASEQIKTELLNKLNEAQHNAKIGSWEWDLATGHVWWSDELYRIFELEPDKFTPGVEANSRYVHPDDNEAYHKEVARVIQKKEELNYDLRIVSGNGNLKYCNSRAILHYDVSENPVRMSGTFSDITERKLAETSLAVERQRLASIIDGTRAGTWEWNLQTNDTIFNEIWATMLGYSLEELSPVSLETWKKLTHPDDLKRSISILDKYFNGEVDFYECEIRMKHKNGEWKWILDRGRITSFDKNGNPLLMHGTHKDITERKQTEEALRKSEVRFRIAQEFSPDGFTILHPLRNKKNEIVDFTWVYENQTIARINQTNPEDVKGKRLLELFPTHKGTTVFEAYIDVANSGKAKIIEEIYVGEVVSVPTWLRLVIIPMEEDIAVLAQDITERKKAEEALLHSHDLMKYIIEHNQTSVAVLDKNLRYLYVSQRFLSEYRVKEKNIIGKHHYEVFPEIPEKWKKIHQKALQGIVSRADEDMFHRIDGTFDWTRWECRPWYEVDGLIGGIILYLEVISEQKKKELEIIKLNQRLEILIGSVQQLAAAQSLETVQDIVAKSARKLIGADGATLVFRENDNCFYVNEDAIQPLWKGKKFPMHSCISGWVMQNKMSVVIEDIFVDDRIPKDAYSPTFVKSLAMVPINISEPIGAIGNYWKETYSPTEIEMQLLQTLADATARAIENIQLYSELEERVKRRTQQLHAVNKELETFTYSVSHDLKAPLRGIDGYSKLLLDEYGESLNEEATHFIKTIRSSTLQMNLLIEDLLSYSRLERSHFKQEKIALKSFTETLVLNFSEEIKKGRFEVVINIPDVEIFTDSTGLTIILRNFVENAH
ncbi:MAG: PAS domain S-box protein [Draconibacterium sp.]